jgi:hypothetical protein
MRSPVCPFCGATSPSEVCAECNQSSAGIAWTVEARGWSPLKFAMEIVLLTSAGTLFLLPVVHGIAAVFIFMGSWKGADGIIARLFAGLFVAMMAAVEVSLIRGLVGKLMNRWARKWSFRAVNGAGWVRMARWTPLAGWGQIRGNSVSYRWIADYQRGQRTHSP